MAKKTKSEADYEMAKSGGDECADCQWFEPPGGCEIVEGRISPRGWCKFWHGAAGRRGERVMRRSEVTRRSLGELRSRAETEL